jgi:putative transposase
VDAAKPARPIVQENAIWRLDGKGRDRERIQAPHKDATVLPSAETAAMLFWSLLASGQITMRKVDGWQTLADKLVPQSIDLAA